MTLGHFLYIPGVLCLGLLIGYILGGRAAEVARADREQQARRRAARQAAGAERQTAGAERQTAGAERQTAGAERQTAGAERQPADQPAPPEA
jgi:hypothetical protein